MKISKQIRAAVERRTAASSSWISRKISETIFSMEDNITAVVKKYTGGKLSRAKVEKTAHGILIRLWMDLEENSTREEAQELSDIILGKGSSVGTHKLKKGMWVANQIIKLPN